MTRIIWDQLMSDPLFSFFIPSINMKHIRFICLCADFWKSQTLTKSISFHSTRLSYLDFLHSFANLFVMITFLCKARQWTTSIHCLGLSSFSHEYLLFINYTVTDSLFYQGYYIYIYIYIFIFSYVSMYIEHTFKSILIEVGAPLPIKHQYTLEDFLLGSSDSRSVLS